MRHIGDMKMLQADQKGVAYYDYADRFASLFGELDVRNNAMTVHEFVDDLGLAGTPGSIKGGSAGPRLACCNIVEITKEEYESIDPMDFIGNLNAGGPNN